jgi:hypothetical protein
MLSSCHTLFLLESFRIDTDKALESIIFLHCLEVLYLHERFKMEIKHLTEMLVQVLQGAHSPSPITAAAHWEKAFKIGCFTFHLAPLTVEIDLHPSTVRGAR